MSIAPAAQSTQITLDERLQFVFNLHSSLDIRAVLHQFAYGLSLFTGCVQLQYQHPELAIDFIIGTKGTTQFVIPLLETHQGLGHMTLSYPEALQRSQITEIEELTGLLFSPLCNALTHQRALNAALKDSLTGLGNRSALLPTLHQEFEFARRHNLPLSLLALDIDHFKAINDTYGHPIGDHYLRHFSSVLQKTVRDSDLSYRIGGEEFVVLLRNTDTLGAMKLASRLTQAIRSAALTHQDQSILTTTSIGVATYTPNETPESLLERADQALYHAKHQGRDRVSHLNFQGEPSNG